MKKFHVSVILPAVVLAGLAVSSLSFSQKAKAIGAADATPETSQQDGQRGDDDISSPPEKADVEKFMEQKLKAAQRTMRAVMVNDFQLIRDECSSMVDLSRHAAWKQMASPVYLQDTADFVDAAEFLQKMAAAEDAEGVSLAFARLTTTCTHCHLHVRTPRVAFLDREDDGRRLQGELVLAFEGL